MICAEMAKKEQRYVSNRVSSGYKSANLRKKNIKDFHIFLAIFA